MAGLSIEETLLLENLTYLGSPLPKANEGETVSEWLNKIDMSKLDDPGFTSNGYFNYTTADEWKDIINEVKNNPNLMDMQIAGTGPDDRGCNSSIVFVNDKTGDAVVAFKGTGEGEWLDNFMGGTATNSADGFSTPAQEEALKWYQEQYTENNLSQYNITVTGHSKGGNKAKYITLMDPNNSIDQCYSFDGQGFSDEMINANQANIAARQHKITNCNVDYDYVNMLLNDVGDTVWYKGYNRGDDNKSFAENHCPNAFFKKENGELVMQVTDGQAVEIKELDKFLNSCIRSMEGQEKENLLILLGTIAEAALGKKPDNMSEFIRSLLNDEKNQESAAYLIAYLIKYEQSNPEFMDCVRGIFDEFGMGDFIKYADLAEEILNSKYFDKLYDIIYNVAGGIANSGGLIGAILDKILEELRKKGYDITREDIMAVLGILGFINEDMDEIVIDQNSGEDIKIGSGSGGRPADFHIQTTTLYDAVEKLGTTASMMSDIADSIDIVQDDLMLYEFFSLWRIKRICTKLRRESQKCTTIQNALNDISKLYDNYEQKCIDHVPVL